MPEKSKSPIIITPVSIKKSRESYKYYMEHRERIIRDKQLMWDDAHTNPTKIAGGLFGFVHQFAKNSRVEIHKIIKVTSRSNNKIPDSWKSVKVRPRNILYLSECLCVIPWKKWEEWKITKWHERGTRPIRDQEKSSEVVEYVAKIQLRRTKIKLEIKLRNILESPYTNFATECDFVKCAELQKKIRNLSALIQL